MAQTFENIGRNVKAAYDQKAATVTLVIDVSEKALKAAPPSSTGKTMVAASTGGFKAVGPISLSLNTSHKA